LAKAHRQGIIHRDLKPGNIMLTKSGAKLLDFGLAKLQDTKTGEQPESAFETQSNVLTQAGHVLGTAQYMAPEQIDGKEADKRTDIFALGAVLYEMSTGQRSFAGNSRAQVMAAILTSNPPSISTFKPLISPALDHVVRKCLAKDPEDRWQDAGDIAGQLKWISETGSLAGLSAAAIGHSRKRFPIPWVLPIVILAGLCGFLAFHYLRLKDTFDPRNMAFQQVTDLGGIEEEPSLSPDGKTVAYVSGGSGNRDIYVVRVGGRNAINVTGGTPDDDQDPAFSPDGQVIAFRSERQGGGIFTVGATGESLKRITDFGYEPSWSPDGKKMALATEGPLDPTFRQIISKLYLFDLESGQKKLINDGDAVQPAWSPHGYRIAYWGLNGEGGRRDVYTMLPDGGGVVPVTNDQFLDWAPAWSPDGKYLYFISNRAGTMNLWRVRIDEKTGKLLSDVEPLLLPGRYSAHPIISADGKRIAYAGYERHANIEKIAFDPNSLQTTGSSEQVLYGTSGIREIDASPDGKWIAMRYTRDHEDIVLYSTDGKEMRQLTDDVYKDRAPRWSADGKRIVFYSDRTGRYEAWSIAADGSGMQQLTETTGLGHWFPVWSPDGKRIALCNEEGTSIVDVSGNLPAKTVKPLPPLNHGSFMVTSWSPDGKLLAGGAFRPDGNGEIPGVFIYSFETGKYEKVSETGNVRGFGISYWCFPEWLNDNRHLIFTQNGDIYLLDVVTKESRLLRKSPSVTDGVIATISGDNRSIIWSTDMMKSDIWLLTMN